MIIITINIYQYSQTAARTRTGYPPSQTHNCCVVIEVSCKMLTLYQSVCVAAAYDTRDK
jgi:hypothetical protein